MSVFFNSRTRLIENKSLGGAEKSRLWLVDYRIISAYVLFTLVFSIGNVSLVFASPRASALSTEQQRDWPFSEDELVDRVWSLSSGYFNSFRQPASNILYGARLSTKQGWTTPEGVNRDQPKPWGYGSRIADTSLHGGHILVALLDAWEARPDPFLEKNIRKIVLGLKLIGSLPERYPKARYPTLTGLVPRGPHPDDKSAWYDDSSMDQHTAYIISLARFSASSLATDTDKQWIRQSLDKVGHRLEDNLWEIKRADGVTRAHVGFPWTGYIFQHASILLPTVYALYIGTGDEHWLEVFNKFLNEKGGLRWRRLHPGPHVELNAHPIYANQGSFRLNSLYRFLSDSEKKSVVRDLLFYISQVQMDRDFPGPWYRKFHSENEWKTLSAKWGWEGDELHGSQDAWERYQPEMLDDAPLAMLAHVRFPLAAYHMVMLSENSALIHTHLRSIWEMLTTIDMGKIPAGEINHLYVVVSMEIYAFYFSQKSFIR